MLRTLLRLRFGESVLSVGATMSHHGGMHGTLMALRRRGLISRSDRITNAGKAVLKKSCLMIQWSPAKIVRNELVCPKCGEPAEEIIGVTGRPCYAHR